MFYRKSSDDAENLADRVIHFIDDRGQTLPAESLSDVIRAISAAETRVHRPYYDETDQAMVERLRDGNGIG